MVSFPISAAVSRCHPKSTALSRLGRPPRGRFPVCKWTRCLPNTALPRWTLWWCGWLAMPWPLSVPWIGGSGSTFGSFSCTARPAPNGTNWSGSCCATMNTSRPNGTSNDGAPKTANASTTRSFCDKAFARSPPNCNELSTALPNGHPLPPPPPPLGCEGEYEST